MGAISICVLVLLLAAVPASARPTAESFRPVCPTLRQLGEASLEVARESLQEARGDRQRAVALYRARNARLTRGMTAGATEACRRGLVVLAERVLWHEGVWAGPMDEGPEVGGRADQLHEAERLGRDLQNAGRVLELAGAVAALAGLPGANPAAAVGGGVAAALGIALDFAGGKMAEAAHNAAERERSDQR